jgi:exosortase A
MRHPAAHKLALLVGIFAFLIIVFGTSFESMWDLWQTSDHRHGLLVFPISAFLMWRLRHEIADMPFSTDARGLLLLVPLAMAWLLARLAGIQVVEHALVLAMFPVVALTLAGTKIVRKLMFPLGFLLLATPLGESFIPYLMVITADLSAGLLEISGIPHLRDGQYISLSGGSFVVADVCAGLRYLTSGVMLALLFGYLTYSSIRKRVLLVIATAITLVVTNGVRAYIVMAVASATEMEYLGGRDHVYFGWLMFGVVMMLIMWVGARFADADDTGDADYSDTLVARASHSVLPLIAALGLVMLAVTIKPLQADFGETGAMLAAAAALFAFIFLLMRHKEKHPEPHVNERSGPVDIHFQLRQALTTVAVVAILVATPRFADAIENKPVAAVGALDLVSLMPCVPEGPWQRRWQPQFVDPDLQESTTFKCDGESVSVFVAAYASALQGAELISSSNHIVPPQWDRVTTRSNYTVQDREQQGRTIGEIQIDTASYKAIVWYWYEVNNHLTSSQMLTKANQVLALLRGRPAGGRVVVLERRVDSDIDRAREHLQSIVPHVMGTDAR